MDSNQDTVTLEAFADRVGCHFTTASRLRSGDRMPSRELLGRIVEAYDLDRDRTLTIFTSGTPDEFGAYLRETIFKGDLSSVQLAGETGNDRHDTNTRNPAA